MKLTREEVEAVLVLTERVASPNAVNRTIAELCRMWLAVQDAPTVEVIVHENKATFFRASSTAGVMALLGKRVRLVVEE